jgi:hypothetical protein
MSPVKRRSLARLTLLFASGIFVKFFIFPSTSTSSSVNPNHGEIREHNVLERVSGADKTLNVQKHDFFQVRMGRDERPDIFDDYIDSGITDWWERFQMPL